MEFDLSEIITEAYLIVSGIFHSVIVILLIYWTTARCIEICPRFVVNPVDRIYRSRSIVQIVRISKVFRLSALIPIFLLILIYSGSRLLNGILIYLQGFTNFFLGTSYDISFQHLRLGDDDQLGRLLKSACGDACASEIGQLTLLSYGDFINHFRALENEVAATSPELLERTYSLLNAPWEFTILGYLVATKSLLIIVIATFLLRRWIEKTTSLPLSGRRRRAKTVLLLLFLVIFFRLEWEREVEFSVMRDFNAVVSSSTPRLSLQEQRTLHTSVPSLIDWRVEKLQLIKPRVWLRYHYNQLKGIFCLPTIGLVATPEWTENFTHQMCLLKHQAANIGKS